MPIPAVIPILFAIGDLMTMGITGKDVIHHVTGVDVWGYIFSPIFGPPGADNPAGATDVVNPTAWDIAMSWALPLALVIGAFALGYWYFRIKPKKRGA